MSPIEKHDNFSNVENDVPLPLTKKPRVEEMDNCREEGIDLSMKEERRKIENDVSIKEESQKLKQDIERSEISPSLFRATQDKGKLQDDDNTKVDNEPTKQNINKTEYSDIKNQAGDKDRILSSTKGVRKRKSLNPIKCPTTSDDDLQFASTDDSSSDTYIDQDNDENGLLDSKSDYLTSDGSDSINDLDDMDDNISENEKDKNHLKINQ
ncbi:zinc finger protein basonuclin-2 [Caerostris extrusa]|uniref:Zinc finger protein basonuclin-2 n=1 Tax=Caerostris extrusa TaxID=172846 RepID=A0AAV4MY14_CAEEX|nr:zinc finger protein basonuclin-2 [Caerostris extrusa]